jgi:hypothetical protein
MGYYCVVLMKQQAQNMLENYMELLTQIFILVVILLQKPLLIKS